MAPSRPARALAAAAVLAGLAAALREPQGQLMQPMLTEECSSLFDSLSAQHGLRHPRDTLPLVQHPIGTPQSLPAGHARQTEMRVRAEGGNKQLWVEKFGSRPWVHPERLVWLRDLFQQLPPDASFEAHMDTSDLSASGNPRVEIVTDSAMPNTTSDRQLLLPIHQYLWLLPQHRMKTLPASHPAYDITRRNPYQCFWRGGSSGHAHWQHRTHQGRKSCPSEKTDRQCIVELRAPSFLNVTFGKDPNIVGNPSEAWVPGCALAIDGYGFAGVMSDILMQGTLLVRVGGYKHGPGQWRRSDFSWMEPFLVEGRHYYRTDLDDLTATLAALQKVPVRTLAAVAEAGRLAVRELFSPKAVRCYAQLAVRDFRRAQDLARPVEPAEGLPAEYPAEGAEAPVAGDEEWQARERDLGVPPEDQAPRQ